MDILLDNPLASMGGLYFLVFYVGFIVITLVLFGLIKGRIDKTDRLALPPIPPNIDPYEIAYLRGGTNEVARSVVFALMQKSLIEFKTTGTTTQIKRTANQPPRLNQIEQIALDWLKNSRDSKDIFQTNGLVTQLEAYSDAFKARLAQQQMLVGEDLENKLSRWKWLMVLAIAGLGGYKILAAFSHGKLNVFGIIIIGAVGLIIAFLVSKLPRLTKRGTAYLERLQLAFDGLKNQTQQAYMPSGAPKVVPSATFAGVDPLLLSVGVLAREFWRERFIANITMRFRGQTNKRRQVRVRAAQVAEAAVLRVRVVRPGRVAVREVRAVQVAEAVAVVVVKNFGTTDEHR